MRFAKRTAVFFLRPIYRTFFEAPLWRILRVVKGFFFAEVRVQLDNIERVQREYAERIRQDRIERLQRENYDRVQREKSDKLLHDGARSQFESIGRQIVSGDLATQQRWAAIEERLKVLEASNAAQWDALEQLLLALFRQSQLQASDPAEDTGKLQHAAVSGMTNLGRGHAAGNLR